MPDLTNPIPPPQLESGDMTMFQSFLANMGFPPGPIDGQWGPKTQAAWLKFAQDNGVDHQRIDTSLWEAITSGQTDQFTEGPGGNTPILDLAGADGGTGLTISNSAGDSGFGDGAPARFADSERDGESGAGGV